MQGIKTEFFIDTKIGKLLISVSGNKISRISFNQPDYSIKTGVKPKFLNTLETQLLAYFNRHRKTFDIEYVLEGTDFQMEVWKKLQDIPYGTTLSYAKLAAQLGDVKKTRAVANAIAKNPLPILIPCHRVIGEDGSLTGYIGGIRNKKFLIETESNRQLGLFP